MPISPIDIQQQQFRTRPFGYDKTGVDQFLEMLAEEMTRLICHNNDLEEELSRVRTRLNEMQQCEATLKEALLTTQRMTDQLKSEARREAEAMMAHAELRAERLLRKAEDRRYQLIAELQDIKRQKIDFEISLRALLEKHVRMLELDQAAIEASPAAARLLESASGAPAQPSPQGTGPRAASARRSNPPGAPAAAAAHPNPANPAQPEIVDLPFDFNSDSDDSGSEPFR